jgi:hypothetical protein
VVRFRHLRFIFGEEHLEHFRDIAPQSLFIEIESFSMDPTDSFVQSDDEPASVKLADLAGCLILSRGNRNIDRAAQHSVVNSHGTEYPPRFHVQIESLSTRKQKPSTSICGQ